jgi:hypothetical protein
MKIFIYDTSLSISWHHLLQSVGLGFFFLSLKERKILTVHRSVHYSAIHDVRPLPGGAADFSNK